MVNKIIFDEMSQCTEAEVARLLPLVSDQRREQALKFRHLFGQYACLKSYELLTKLLQQSSPIFSYNEHGKPELPGIHFSISHCKLGIAVVVSDSPVGIDIESIHREDETLIKRTMNEQERAMIRQSPDPSVAFTSLWTQKEAILKLQGTGLVDDLYSVISDSQRTETYINKEKGYCWSLAW